jgi:hypothetical protein
LSQNGLLVGAGADWFEVAEDSTPQTREMQPNKVNTTIYMI